MMMLPLLHFAFSYKQIQKRDNKIRDLERDVAEANRKHEDARNEVSKMHMEICTCIPRFTVGVKFKVLQFWSWVIVQMWCEVV